MKKIPAPPGITPKRVPAPKLPEPPFKGSTPGTTGKKEVSRNASNAKKGK